MTDRLYCKNSALFDDKIKPIKWKFSGKIIINKGLLSKEEHSICWSCQRYMMNNDIGDRDFKTHTFNSRTIEELDKSRQLIIEASLKENPPEKRTFEYWTDHQNGDTNRLDRIKSLRNDIVNLLKKHGTKIPASDIDAHLKHQKVDEVKKVCEEMYHNGKINRTGNYRYFILSEKKKKPMEAATAKADPTVELRKYAKLKDDGIITEEDFNIKKKELLGL